VDTFVSAGVFLASFVVGFFIGAGLVELVQLALR
jgi:hypothetical protein